MEWEGELEMAKKKKACYKMFAYFQNWKSQRNF